MLTPNRRPSVFVGSSTEGLPVAEAIQQNLDRACEVAIWSQGVFGLSQGTLESLVLKLADFDFAILVLTPDDMIESRGSIQQAARDNVLIELGLFVGALGRERTFVLFNRSAGIRVPSDLAGVTLANFQPHASGNLQASLGASCTQIKTAIERLGIRQQDQIKASVGQNTTFQIISDLLEEVARQFFILMHEQNKQLQRESMWNSGTDYEYWTANHSAGHGAFRVDTICQKLPDAGLLTIDLRGKVGLTERGHEFAQWLIERGHKAAYFGTKEGGWGTKPPEGIFQKPPAQKVDQGKLSRFRK